jgi:uncharacterized protein with von Willebrand factor type A (vWA) domain
MLLPNRKPVQLQDGQRPVLVVVVDTEEEFAWDQPFDRANIDTQSVASQPMMHKAIFDRFGIVPTYMVDWPVVNSPAAVQTLAALQAEGRCDIGTQLHPWVSPPHDEVVCEHNSFAGNLPQALERAKLTALTERIETAFGVRPTAYKAGRYGIGANTAEILGVLGYRIDTSVVPYTSFAALGGPDFTGFDEQPFWFRAGAREMLELPVTTGFCGLLREHGRTLYPLAQQGMAGRARLGAVLARSRMLERIRLSPEGASAADLKRVVRQQARAGCKVFSLTYHSPSLVPGHTPYVRSAADLAAFLHTVEAFCEFFRDELGGVFMNMAELYRQLRAAHAPAPAAYQ